MKAKKRSSKASKKKLFKAPKKKTKKEEGPFQQMSHPTIPNKLRSKTYARS